MTYKDVHLGYTLLRTGERLEIMFHTRFENIVSIKSIEGEFYQPLRLYTTRVVSSY